LRTEVQGKNGPNNRQSFNTEKRVTNPKDFYQGYFGRMKKQLNLKQNAYDLAMDKVDRFLSAYAKAKETNEHSKFRGQKEAYACTIMYLVSNELNL